MTRKLKGVALAALAGILALSMTADPAAARDTGKGRWLKIRVYEHGATTPTVLVNLPMSLVTAAMKIAARTDATVNLDSPAEGGEKTRLRIRDFDLEALVKEIDAMEPGQIVEVQDGDDKVSIWIE
jgi:hypothetical protein